MLLLPRRVDEVDDRRTRAEGHENLGDRHEQCGVAGRTIVEIHPHERITLELDRLKKSLENDAHRQSPLVVAVPGG